MITQLDQAGVHMMPTALGRYLDVIGKNPELAKLLVAHGALEHRTDFGVVRISARSDRPTFVEVNILNGGNSRQPSTDKEYTAVADIVESFKQRERAP